MIRQCKESLTNAGGAQREILALGEAGYREVTLLGQNVDAYGRDLPGAAVDGSGVPPQLSDVVCANIARCPHLRKSMSGFVHRLQGCAQRQGAGLFHDDIPVCFG